VPLPTPPKKTKSAVVIGGRGWQDMRWTMTMTMMARGGSKGKSINNSISEHKRIVTSNIIYSITVIKPINNNCMVALFL
jgi:hypothetical protein